MLKEKNTLASKRDSGTGTNPGTCDAKVWSHCSEDAAEQPGTAQTRLAHLTGPQTEKLWG